MKLLNSTYPAPIRGLFAGCGFLVGWIASGHVALGTELAKSCWQDTLKTAARRGAWYLRRGWIGIDILPDEWFDPTEGLTNAQLDKLDRFIVARSRATDRTSTAADRAFVAARRLDNIGDPAAHLANLANFRDACGELLAHAELDPTEILAPIETTKPARVGDFPIQDARQTLSDFATLFPLSDMRWFLVSGSFLGLIRENGFLPHDYDIDIGVFEDEIDIDATIAAVARSGRFVLKKYDHHTSSLFRPEIEVVNPAIPYILKLVHLSGVHIDLFIHYRDTQSTPASYWHGSSLHRWNNSPFELKTYNFYDMQVLGPADADTYLTENYGDWRTPVTEFNCTTDTPNLVLMPHPVAVVIFLKRYVMARRKGKSQADGLQAELIHNGFLKVDSGQLRFSSDRFAAFAF